MTFPTTAIIDNFNRANGAIGANYTTPTFLSTMNVSSNAAIANGANAVAIRNTATYADCEIYATLSTKPADGGSASLLFRLVDTATAMTFDGYLVGMTAVAGAGNDTLQVYRITNGTPTAIGAAFTQEISAGAIIGARMIGSTIEVFLDGVSLGTRTDSTYTGAGYLALGFGQTSGAWDDFGGGTPVRRTKDMIDGGIMPVRRF